LKTPDSHNARQTRTPHGIALVVTLLVIVILTIAVTAFMQSMGLERRTSRAYLNILKADEAVQAGLQRVGNIFSSYAANDYYTIVKAENIPSPGATPIPYYFIGTGYDATSGNNKVPAPTVYTPLFSYQAAAPSTIPTPPAAAPGASNNLPIIPSRADPAINKPLVQEGMPPVNTSWESINTGDPAFPTIRYCFWVEDLGGRLDVSRAGNKAEIVGSADTLENNENNDKHLRNGSYACNQLGLFTLFNKTSQTDPGANAAGTLYNYRPLLLTLDSVKQALGTAATTFRSEIATSLTANLTSDQETPIIPYGLGFNRGGQLKIDVNGVIADATTTSDQKVTTIATVIQNNLPKFDLRKGANYGRFKDPSASSATGLHDYIKTIAANIIDYADTDNLATAGAEYRGVDSYPFITEWGHRYVFVSNTGGLTEVNVTPFLEFWNLTDKPISGTFKFIEDNTDGFTNGLNSADFRQIANVTNQLDIENIYSIDSANPLLPNDYRVVQLATLNYKFPSGGTPVFPNGIPINEGTTRITSSYKFYWGDTVVDETFKCKQESVARSLPLGQPRWTAYLPGFRYLFSPGNTSVFWNASGDPRSTFYINKLVAVNAFNSDIAAENRQTWGGRNNWMNFAQTQANQYPEREMNPSKWLDKNHGNSNLGTRVGRGDNPSTVPIANSPQIETVSSISNAGNYVSITELGHIYDPAQWNAKGSTESASTIPNYAPLATDIPANAGNALGSGADGWGGGFTLRIGRPEFTRFMQPDVEPAWKLLDLLSAGAQRDTTGLININTASKDVLRSLVAGLVFKDDPGIRTGFMPIGNAAQIPKTYPYSSAYPVVSPATQADFIAQAIIDSRPYLSVSQLSNLRTPTGLPVFGDLARWFPNDPDRPTEWDDAGAEEMFKSVYELSTVRSRNFRVFVTGQVLNRQGKVVAATSKSFQIATVPIRNPATKLVTRLQIKIKNEVAPL
jgi:hypothetical protein